MDSSSVPLCVLQIDNKGQFQMVHEVPQSPQREDAGVFPLYIVFRTEGDCRVFSRLAAQLFHDICLEEPVRERWAEQLIVSQELDAINDQMLHAYKLKNFYVDVCCGERPKVYCEQLDGLAGMEGSVKEADTKPALVKAHVFGSFQDALVLRVVGINHPTNQLYYYCPNERPLNAPWVRKFMIKGIKLEAEVTKIEAFVSSMAQEAVHAWATLYIQTHSWVEHRQFIQNLWDGGSSKKDFINAMAAKFGKEKEKARQYTFMFATFEKLR
ncbi:hypothetical protein PQX77_013244 [Marasmius sp. AFHP31]|nr:hypothetical protein PQX77_013244 [Marasmius sp. AFHP31]